MAGNTTPSYTDLAHDVLRSAGQPLPLAEIVTRVEIRRPITTRNPKQTVRNAITNAQTLVSVGGGMYGYLPHLLRDSVLCLPVEKDEGVVRGTLVFSHELRLALWPGYFDAGKRRLDRPVTLQLRDGPTVTLTPEFFGPGEWGSTFPIELIEYLEAHHVEPGDALIIRVLEGEAGRAEGWHEPRSVRESDAVAQRNQELLDAAFRILYERRAADLPIWELATALLARGAYRAEIAPDSLQDLLQDDPRLADIGFELLDPDDLLPSEFEPTILPLLPGIEPGSPSPLPLLGGPAGIEQAIAGIHALLTQQEFGSIDEINAYLSEVLATGRLPEHEPTTPLERAQDLIYQAASAKSRRARLRLARQALEVSSDCADAYVLLADEGANDPREAADLYRQGIAAAERVLGPEPFEQDAGHFWGIFETRPYMRARYGLALALWEMDEHEAAIGHMEELLRLNPGDNQGVRYVLLSRLVEIGDDSRVGALLKRYLDDASAVWVYTRALHGFRTEGDIARTRRLRREALASNRHVPDLLLGRRALPRTLPALVGFGDESEAIDLAAEHLPAWQRTPGALDWLAAGLQDKPTRPRRAR